MVGVGVDIDALAEHEGLDATLHAKPKWTDDRDRCLEAPACG
jgi:hypothetical protein